MQVGTFVNVNAVAKLDLISKSHSHTALNGSGPIHVQNQPIEKTSYHNTQNRGNPTDKEIQSLLKTIPKERRSLAIKI
jgi:hypothetical protein